MKGIEWLTNRPHTVLFQHLFSAGTFNLLDAEWEDDATLSLRLQVVYWNPMIFDVTVNLDDEMLEETFETLNDFLTELKPLVKDAIQETFASEDVVAECISSIYGIDEDTIDKLLTDYNGMSKRAEDYENGDFELKIS